MFKQVQIDYVLTVVFLALHAMAFAEPPKTVAEMKIMQDSPPEKLIDISNWDKGPDSRWTFQHISEIIPIAKIKRNSEMLLMLSHALRDFTEFVFGNHNDEEMIVNNSENGVMTNSPHIDRHVNNLRNYSHVNPKNTLPPSVMKEFGWAVDSGLRGLPGDYTSTSRFVKTSVMKFYAGKPKDGIDAYTQALHLLNNIDYVPGVAVFAGQRRDSGPQLTTWVTVCNLKSLYYYFCTFDSHVPHRIDLKKLNFEKEQTYRRTEFYCKQKFIDNTVALQKGKIVSK